MLIDFKWFYAIPFFLIYILATWKHSISWLYRAIHLIFLSYMIILLKETFFPVIIRPPEYAIPIGKNNLIPFQSIQEIINHSIPGVALVQIGGNLLMLVPMGFYLSLLWKKINTLPKALMVAVSFSLGIEVLQWSLTQLIGQDYRNFDVDDILLNVTGYLLGYLILRFSVPILKNVVDVKHLYKPKAVRAESLSR